MDPRDLTPLAPGPNRLVSHDPETLVADRCWSGRAWARNWRTTVIERKDGHSWRLERAPSPTREAQFDGVTCLNATGCVPIGYGLRAAFASHKRLNVVASEKRCPHLSSTGSRMPGAF